MDFVYAINPTTNPSSSSNHPHQALADALYSDAMAYTNHQRAARAAADKHAQPVNTNTLSTTDGALVVPTRPLEGPPRPLEVPPRPLEFHADGRVKADVSRHNRRGTPGEWRLVFEDVHKEVFMRRFGGLVSGLLYDAGEEGGDGV